VAADKTHYWFPAKRHGWGWGFPRAWQGWTVIALYTGVVAVAALAGREAGWGTPVIVAASVGLLLVCLRKGEPARWRWGGDE
jgi:hypothetical protein